MQFSSLDRVKGCGSQQVLNEANAITTWFGRGWTALSECLTLDGIAKISLAGSAVLGGYLSATGDNAIERVEGIAFTTAASSLVFFGWALGHAFQGNYSQAANKLMVAGTLGALYQGANPTSVSGNLPISARSLSASDSTFPLASENFYENNFHEECQTRSSSEVNIGHVQNSEMHPQQMLVIRSEEFADNSFDEKFRIAHQYASSYFENRMIENAKKIEIKYRNMSLGICQALTSYTEEEKLKPDVLELFNHGTPTSMMTSKNTELTIDDLYQQDELIDCIKRNLKPESQIFLKSCSVGRSTKEKYYSLGVEKDLSAYPKNFAQVFADLTGHVVQAPTQIIYPIGECKIDWDDEKNRAKLSCIPIQLYSSRAPYFQKEYTCKISGNKYKEVDNELFRKNLYMKEMVETFYPSSDTDI